MSTLLPLGKALRSGSGKTTKIIKSLGSGGQGEVYLANWGDAGQFAVKWYYPQSATAEQREALRLLIKDAAPNGNFLWPLDLVEDPGSGSFGYIMPVREARYRGLHEYVAGRVTVNAITRINIGLELTKAYHDLHVKGLCYCDISFGNAFFDAANGDVLICDNDNVRVNRSAISGILGTPDFMAPEIVRGVAKPSNLTDLYSLGVLLFYLFHFGHPLQGKNVLKIHCWDIAARNLLFGKDPVFIFDPKDKSNAAVGLDVDPTGEAGGMALKFWPMYPAAFRNTFVRAFTEGLKDPDRRVTEREWLEALSALRNAVFQCSCGSANFYDAEALESSAAYAKRCWKCGHELKLPFRLRIGRSVVMLTADATVTSHHVGNGEAFDFSTAVAEVVKHPTNPNVWGLKNLTDKKWVATLPNGSLRDVEPGRSVPLVTETKINFGSVEGEIRY
jgi:DNA-binding helix-hairpin-helix protein with protein kinase domain